MENIYPKDKINLLLTSEEVKNIFGKYYIKSAITFGSINTEDFNEESDVDIAIIGNNKVELEIIIELELYLQNLVKREIDVIDLRCSNLDLFLKIGILNDGTIIYSSDDNNNLEDYKEQLDLFYRENENFIYFRRKDVLS